MSPPPRARRACMHAYACLCRQACLHISQCSADVLGCMTGAGTPRSDLVVLGLTKGIPTPKVSGSACRLQPCPPLAERCCRARLSRRRALLLFPFVRLHTVHVVEQTDGSTAVLTCTCMLACQAACDCIPQGLSRGADVYLHACLPIRMKNASHLGLSSSADVSYMVA